MANRVATSGDVSTYASKTKGLLVQGDIIMERGEVNGSPSAGILYYTSFASDFSTARANPVMWIDALAIGTMYQIWITTATGRGHITIRPMTTGPIRVVTNSSTNSGQTVVLTEFDGLTIDGEFLNNLGYPGMTHGLGQSAFLTGTFGFSVTYGTLRNENNQFYIKINDGGAFIGRGFEVWGGFAAFALQQGIVSTTTIDVTLQRVYLHDGQTGEGTYIGLTLAEVAKIRNLVLEDVLIVRRGTEDCQLQNLIAASAQWSIKNVVFAQSAIAYKGAFEANQDGNTQIQIDNGKGRFSNFIMDGGISGLKVFGLSGGGGTEPAEFYNGLMQNMSQYLLYLHSTAAEAFRQVFENVEYRNKGTRHQELGYASTNYFVLDQGDPSKRSYLNVKHDSSVSTFASSGSITGSQKVNSTSATITAPEFVNTGFNADEQPVRWFNLYAAGCPNAGNNTTWTAGNIVIDGADGNNYRFYKVNTNHTSNGTPPASNANMTLLTWDTSGVRSDMGGHNSGTAQSYFPPDDWRLVADNYHNLKGRGLLSNELNTNATQIQHYRAATNSPQGDDRFLYPIPGANSKTYIAQEVDRGWYLSMCVRPRNQNGQFGTPVFGEWKQPI